MRFLRVLAAAAALLMASPVVSATEVILTGGVALRSWENWRGPAAHDNWWANFVRASTIEISLMQQKDPAAKIVWIVYRPAYLTRSKENNIDYIPKIQDTAKKLGVKLVWVDSADAACKAISAAGKKSPITSFYYFGHSNPHAFMLDYSNFIMAASKDWIHEKDLAAKIDKNAFAPNAECWSYGCYTGRSMSKYWREAFGVLLWGNTESTRYQPVGEGKLPEGAGKWVH